MKDLENGESKNCFLLKFCTVWKCPNTEFFLVHPVFGLNARKYGPVKTPYFDIFHAVLIQSLISDAGLMRNNFKWFFVTFFFRLYIWNKVHERLLLLRYSDTGTFNLIIEKIGFIEIYYSEVHFDKLAKRSQKGFESCDYFLE